MELHVEDLTEFMIWSVTQTIQPLASRISRLGCDRPGRPIAFAGRRDRAGFQLVSEPREW